LAASPSASAAEAISPRNFWGGLHNCAPVLRVHVYGRRTSGNGDFTLVNGTRHAIRNGNLPAETIPLTSQAYGSGAWESFGSRAATPTVNCRR